jgi:hypothetical protein
LKLKIQYSHRVTSLVLLLPIFFFVGCQNDSTVVVRKILVDLDEAVEKHVQRDLVRKMTQQIILSDDGVRFDSESSKGGILRVYLHSLSVSPLKPVDEDKRAASETKNRVSGPGDGATVVTLALSIALTGVADKLNPREKKISHQGHGTGTTTITGAMDIGSVAPPLVKNALSGAIQEIMAKRDLASKPSAELIEKLKDSQLARRQTQLVVEFLGLRREKEAIPLLVEIMKSDDRELAQYAVGALARIGAPNAVDDMIEYASGKPASLRKLVIEAMRVAGTPKAKAWLFTLSKGHPDPEVQLAASSALSAFTRAGGPATANEGKKSP